MSTLWDRYQKRFERGEAPGSVLGIRRMRFGGVLLSKMAAGADPFLLA
jgi:DNA-directed RNA polymerase subunit N (RpoN/RPB10)